MDWNKLDPRTLSGLGTHANADRCDPWLLWSLATGFAGHPDMRFGLGDVKQLLVAAEFCCASAQRSPLVCAPAYAGQHHVTGAIDVDKLAELTNNPQLIRFRLGAPLLGDQWPRSPDRLPKPLPPGQVPIVAVIDYGFAFANRAFRNNRGGSRVVAMWDQSPDRTVVGAEQPKGWNPVAGFGYGCVLTKRRIDKLIKTFPDDEMRLYAEAKYPPAQRRISHGTHVLDLAAGHPDPMTLSVRPARDAAANAPILLVQLPAKPAMDTSGVSLCVHLLDALHWIAAQSGARKVVVNLSDGTYAGPHDGTSLLESAIDDFLNTHPNVTFVIAAGNGYEEHGHASLCAPANGTTSPPMSLRLLPEDSTDSFVEVWLPRGLSARARVSLRLRPPGMGKEIVVKLGEHRVARSDGRISAAVMSTRSSPNAPGRAMFLVALAPTRVPRRSAGSKVDPRAPAPHGIWQICVNNASTSDIRVDAWIERDDPALGDRSPRRQARFVGGHPPAYVSKEQTLNSVATGAFSIVVGGLIHKGKMFEDRNVTVPNRMATYSSSGPGRSQYAPVTGPNVAAASEFSPNLHGLLAAANRSELFPVLVG